MSWHIPWLLESFLLTLLYEKKAAEYILFAWYNEYLITHFCRKGLPIGPREHVLVESSIGHLSGRFFAKDVERLEKTGIPILKRVMTLQAFTEFARTHPALKGDPFVQLRLEAVDSGIARR